MATKCQYLTFVMATLALLGLTGFGAGKMTTTSFQMYRDAKAKQDADRRGTERKRQEILAHSAAKFAHQQRLFGSSYVKDSWNQKSRNLARRKSHQKCQKDQNFQCSDGRGKYCQNLHSGRQCDFNDYCNSDGSSNKQYYPKSAGRSFHRYY